MGESSKVDLGHGLGWNIFIDLGGGQDHVGGMGQNMDMFMNGENIRELLEAQKEIVKELAPIAFEDEPSSTSGKGRRVNRKAQLLSSSKSHGMKAYKDRALSPQVFGSKASEEDRVSEELVRRVLEEEERFQAQQF
ncbi:hypothetical protein Q3G72_009446 [Acer saccharum]|nr:hypothetical protein Q3G72_009446 [Acer saccharum]